MWLPLCRAVILLVLAPASQLATPVTIKDGLLLLFLLLVVEGVTKECIDSF